VQTSEVEAALAALLSTEYDPDTLCDNIAATWNQYLDFGFMVWLALPLEKGQIGRPARHFVCDGAKSLCINLVTDFCWRIRVSVCLYSCCSHFEHRAIVKHFFSLRFLNLRQLVGLLGRGISPPQGRYLHRIIQPQNKGSAIRTYDPSVRASEHSSWRPRGNCVRHVSEYKGKITPSLFR
jgi:hypothetical protein